MRSSRHLVIFTRFPMLGVGKRRLAADIGDVEAVKFQRVRMAILLKTLASDTRWRTWLAITPDHSGPWPQRVGVVRQGSGDLGQRLTRVTDTLSSGHVIIIGSDAPGVRRADIANAFQVLAGHDAVLGPATDGGYWLIGLRGRQLALPPFRNIRWSTSDALVDTVRELGTASLGYVRRLGDVDVGDALSSHPNWNRLVKFAHSSA